MVDTPGDLLQIIDERRISPYVAAATLYHYAASEHTDIAVPPSDWRNLLIKLISKSDVDNRAKLAFVFPGEVAACCLIEWFTDGAKTLRAIAETAVNHRA